MRFKQDQKVSWKGHKGEVVEARVVHFGDLRAEHYRVQLAEGPTLSCSELDLEPVPERMPFNCGQLVRIKGTDFRGVVDSIETEEFGDHVLNIEVYVKEVDVPGIRTGTWRLPSRLLEAVK